MRVLIGCEESQAVCKEFRRLGHEAFSCDLKPCSGGHPEWHIKRDIIDVINGAFCQFGQFWTEDGMPNPPIKWDFIGLHPVCTKMTLSGNRTYGKGKERHGERLDAVEWTITLWQLACKNANHVYLENPMGAMNTDIRMPKPQIIHPFYFGDEFQKTTCLWLQNLPKLIHCEKDNLFENKTHVGKGEMVKFKSGNVMPKWYADAWKLPEFARKELRSKTFPGIAKAMAEQWGGNIINP